MIKNVFVCLVHEAEPCIFDLVQNLSYQDADSQILLYNGGDNYKLLDRLTAAYEQVIIYPSPRRMIWGQLHNYVFDVMGFVSDNLVFDTITIVDSDQLAVQKEYSSYITDHLVIQSDVGMLTSSPFHQDKPINEPVGPIASAFREYDLWKPLLQKYSNWQESFVYWSFWPTTIFTSLAVREILQIHKDPTFQYILSKTKIFASEEVIFPTLTSLLGLDVVRNPCDNSFVKYRTTYSSNEISKAMANEHVFWIHPVIRDYNDPTRKLIRNHFSQYGT